VSLVERVRPGNGLPSLPRSDRRPYVERWDGPPPAPSRLRLRGGRRPARGYPPSGSPTASPTRHRRAIPRFHPPQRARIDRAHASAAPGTSRNAAMSEAANPGNSMSASAVRSAMHARTRSGSSAAQASAAWPPPDHPTTKNDAASVPRARADRRTQASLGCCTAQVWVVRRRAQRPGMEHKKIPPGSPLTQYSNTRPSGSCTCSMPTGRRYTPRSRRSNARVSLSR
jgi:hypothetical protein